MYSTRSNSFCTDGWENRETGAMRIKSTYPDTTHIATIIITSRTGTPRAASFLPRWRRRHALIADAAGRQRNPVAAWNAHLDLMNHFRVGFPCVRVVLLHEAAVISTPAFQNSRTPVHIRGQISLPNTTAREAGRASVRARGVVGGKAKAKKGTGRCGGGRRRAQSRVRHAGRPGRAHTERKACVPTTGAMPSVALRVVSLTS